MAGLLAAYIAVHSPLLRVVGEVVGRDIHRCYFACSGWAPNGRPLDAAAALFALLVSLAAAWLVAARLPQRGAERLLSFGLVALSFVVLPASTIGILGWALDAQPLRPPLGPLLTAAPAALVLVVGVARKWWRPLELPAWRQPGALIMLLAATAFTLLGTMVVLGLVHPPTGYDALAYHAPLAVYFWRDGNLGMFLDQQVWAWALAYPSAMELWAGLLLLAGGEGAANLAQLPFAILGALAAYLFGRRTGLGRGAATIGGLGFLCAPLVVVQAGTQLNDLSGGALLMAGAALVAAPPESWKTSRLVLAGVALGLAIATKLSMLPPVAAVATYVLVVGMRAGRREGLLPAAVSVGVMVAPWWARNLALYGNPIFPLPLPFVGGGLSAGDLGTMDTLFLPGAWAWPLYPLLEPHGEESGFGALLAVGVLPGIVAAALRGRRTPLALYGLIFGVSLACWWFLVPHVPRYIVHLFGLGFAFLGWSLVAVPRRHRRMAAWLLGTAAVFSAAVTADQALKPRSEQPTGRFEFYDRVWGVDSVAAALPEDQVLLSHTGHAPLSYAADYPLLGPGLSRTLISIDGNLPTDSIIHLMRPRGIRHVYVPAAPGSQHLIAEMYPDHQFELMHSSVVGEGDRRGVRRYLFRLREPEEPHARARPSP